LRVEGSVFDLAGDASRDTCVELVEAGIIRPDQSASRCARERRLGCERPALAEATMTDLPEPKPETPIAPEMSMQGARPAVTETPSLCPLSAGA
jgi:hypothetical protein